jgi:hypothetical protein
MIIGLAGYKGSGKDFVADILVEEYGYTKVAFADPIKKFVMDTYSLKGYGEYDAFKRTNFWVLGKHVHGRDIVREIGMMMRGYDMDQFTTYVHEQWLKEPNGKIVVSDLRFDNEYRLIRDLKGKTIRIESDLTKSDGHESEQVHQTDFTLTNNWGTTNQAIQLYKDVQNIMESINK